MQSESDEAISFCFAGQAYQLRRLIGDVGPATGPTVVLIGSMHGNEPTGAVAIHQVMEELALSRVNLRGRVLGLLGNMEALAKNQRQVNQDLNRIWDQRFVKSWNLQVAGDGVATVERELSSTAEPGDSTTPTSAETRERAELYAYIEPLLREERFRPRRGVEPQLFFADLHTTSAPSIPFIAINDQLDNRRFALNFPVPTILGIEEHLEGPLLSLLNDQGHVALAFEAGQHEDPESLELHKSFIYGLLVQTGVIDAAAVAASDGFFGNHHQRLKQACHGKRGIFEITHRQAVVPDEAFVMRPGFENFSEIKKGDEVAENVAGKILAPKTGLMFMPLYQSTGSDGFFIVRQVPLWALRLSRFLRTFNVEWLLVLLPGVARSQNQPDTLVIDKRVARFLAVELFHLLGYRRKQDDGDVMIVSRREIEKK